MTRVNTNKQMCVFVEKQPNKLLTMHTVHMHILLSPFQACPVAWTNPLCPFLKGSYFFNKCWVMFGPLVCWSCTFGPHNALLKARGLSGWASESDHWPGRQAPEYRQHKAGLVNAVVKPKVDPAHFTDAPQHSLLVFTLRPEQINTASYANTWAGAGKAHAQPAAKGGILSIVGLVEADVAILFFHWGVSMSV